MHGLFLHEKHSACPLAQVHLVAFVRHMEALMCVQIHPRKAHMHTGIAQEGAS